MSMQHMVAILGAASGSLGSIITAFSLNTIVRELNIARQGIEHTVEALARVSYLSSRRMHNHCHNNGLGQHFCIP